MATGRTVSANHLTKLDENVLDLCAKLSDYMISSVPENHREDFLCKYAKISRTRDSGLGRGGGKLARDALCTRGRQGKAPFSNRNFRWHPLLVADKIPESAEAVKRIIVEEVGSLTFVIGEDESPYPSDMVHTMPDRFVALPEHWYPYVPVLKNWNDTQWSQNSCVISAMEAANWWDAVETYAVLGMSVVINIYKGNYEALYRGIVNILADSNIGDKRLPSDKFPSHGDHASITKCPVCKEEFTFDLGFFRREERPTTWQPEWNVAKKSEGEDSSIQIMHVDPLIERQMRHNARNVRYGHRWCNVAMTDHSLAETLDFMRHVVKVHEAGKGV